MDGSRIIHRGQLANEDHATHTKRKRPRAIQACDYCRSKKYKCNESYPCHHCKKSGIQCHYNRELRPREDDAGYIQSLEQHIEELSAQLKEKRDGSAQTNDEERREEHHAGPNNRPQHPSPLPAAAATQQTRGTFGTPDDNCNPAGSPGGSEITGVNRHTNGIEFHGNTSSVAFLDNLQRLRATEPARPSEGNTSLVSDLHNHRFLTRTGTNHISPPAPPGEAFYFRHAHLFIDAYFSGIHFIHPFIDKEDFMARANDLWFGHSTRQTSTFIAMYLTLLAIGALTRSWEEETMDGLTRFEWSRKLFSEAQTWLNETQFSNDLDTVHCLYLSAKICQNELNPHLAYMYLGQAIRTCLAAGFNRELPNPKTQRSATLSRTWWGLFSLEIEMSFSLGRPDTLGIDQYHNRRIPDVDDTEFAIIPCMVSFGQVIRKVSVEIYHSNNPMLQNLPLAFQIENELDEWIQMLPARIRPDLHGTHFHSLSALREPTWCRRQRLVLELRYRNVKMLLFRPFLSFHMQNQTLADDALIIASEKCVSCAKATITTIYEIYKLHPYFRTWWYNATYVMVATTALLLFIVRSKTESSIPVIKHIKMAVEILEAMDESVVAKKSAEIVRRYLAEASISAPPPLAVGTSTLENLDSDSIAPSVDSQLNAFEIPGFESIPGLEFLDNSLGDLANIFDGLSGMPGSFY